MLEFKIFGIKTEFTFMFFATLTLFMLADKTGIAFWGFVAAIAHEAGHIAAFILLRNKPVGISFRAGGIMLKESAKITSYKNEAIILLSGSLANLVLAAVLFTNPDPYVKQIAMLNAVLGIFNLIPVCTLDGGKLLNMLLTNIIGPRNSFLISKALSLIICLILLHLSFNLFLQNGNFTLLLVSLFLTISIFINSNKIK